MFGLLALSQDSPVRSLPRRQGQLPRGQTHVQRSGSRAEFPVSWLPNPSRFTQRKRLIVVQDSSPILTKMSSTKPEHSLDDQLVGERVRHFYLNCKDMIHENKTAFLKLYIQPPICKHCIGTHSGTWVLATLHVRSLTVVGDWELESYKAGTSWMVQVCSFVRSLLLWWSGFRTGDCERSL